MPYDGVFPADDVDNPHVADNCALMYLNEASLLHNLRKRFELDYIYTYTANILLAVNPYKQLGIYDQASIDRYRGKSLGVEPPHIFAIGAQAGRSYGRIERPALAGAVLTRRVGRDSGSFLP